MTTGVPFRDAHEIIGKLVLYCIEHNTNLDDLSLEEYKAISPVFDETVYDAIRVEKCVEARNVPGGPSKEYIASLIDVVPISIYVNNEPIRVINGISIIIK
mgnify:CR=1 FL=1